MMQNETNSARLEIVVEVPGYGAKAPPRFTIEEHMHTSRGVPMFICVVDDAVECADFVALRKQACKHRGWYSRPSESTPGGFAFMDRAAAECFADPAGPDDEEEADSAHEPVPPIAAKLHALAEDMRFEIDANLAVRSTNTPKRRFYAALAWVHGHRLLRTQAAMLALADAHIAKTVPTELADIDSKSQVYDRLGTLFDRSSAEYYDIGTDTGEPQCAAAAACALWRLIGAEDPVDPSTELLKQDGISTSADRASKDPAGGGPSTRMTNPTGEHPMFASQKNNAARFTGNGNRPIRASRIAHSGSWPFPSPLPTVPLHYPGTGCGCV